MTILAKQFHFQADPRIMVVSGVEDFELMKDPNIHGVTLPNPFIFPDAPEEVAAILEATKAKHSGMPDKFFSQENLLKEDYLHASIRKTGLLMYMAFSYAGAQWDIMLAARQNSSYPYKKPHNHPDNSLTAIADIYGSTTRGYLGASEDTLKDEYSFPPHHITLFRNIFHKGGPVTMGSPRLTLLLS